MAAAFVRQPLSVLAPLEEAARQLHANMVEQRAPGAAFFEGSVLLDVAVHRHGCDAVNHTAHALQALATPSVRVAAEELAAAIVSVDALLAALPLGAPAAPLPVANRCADRRDRRPCHVYTPAERARIDAVERTGGPETWMRTVSGALML